MLDFESVRGAFDNNEFVVTVLKHIEDKRALGELIARMKQIRKMAKKKYYVVWDGRETGVYNSWNHAKNKSQVIRAVYKSFDSEELANEAFYDDSKEHVGKNKNRNLLKNVAKEKYGEPILESISVDGASSSRGGMSEYRGVFTNNGKEIFRRGPFPDGTNNLMEFLFWYTL